MRKNVVTFSQTAIQQLSRLAKQHSTSRLLLFVKGGGCNGLQYGIEPITQFDPTTPLPDPTVVLEDHCSVQICPKSLPYLFGTHVEWKTDAMGQGFHFANPNAKHQCGCGSTFSI
jgi:iron-sulfur cluster assembly protein